MLSPSFTPMNHVWFDEPKKPEVEDYIKHLHPFACHGTAVSMSEVGKRTEEDWIQYLC